MSDSNVLGGKKGYVLPITMDHRKTKGRVKIGHQVWEGEMLWREPQNVPEMIQCRGPELCQLVIPAYLAFRSFLSHSLPSSEAITSPDPFQQSESGEAGREVVGEEDIPA